MDNTKNIIISVLIIILVVVFGVVWYMFNNVKKFQTQSVQPEPIQQQNNLNGIPVKEIGTLSIFGNVSKIEGKKIIIIFGKTEKTIVTDAATVITEQIKENGGVKNVSANFSDIKPPLQIIVSYTDSSGSEYKANRIQILTF